MASQVAAGNSPPRYCTPAATQQVSFSGTYARTTEREWGGRYSSPEPLPPPSQRRRRRYWHHQDAENPGAERPWVPLHSHKPTRLAVGFGLGEQPYRSPGPDSPLRAQEHTLVPPLLKLRTRLFYEACEHFTPDSDPCQMAEPVWLNWALSQASAGPAAHIPSSPRPGDRSRPCRARVRATPSRSGRCKPCRLPNRRTRSGPSEQSSRSPPHRWVVALGHRCGT